MKQTRKKSPTPPLSDALRKTEERYRLVFDNAPVGILHYDENGVIQNCNNKFLQIMGTAHEKVIGMDMSKMPDQKAREAVKDSLLGKVGYYNGYYTATTSKKITPLRAVLKPMLNSAGKLIGGIGIFEDMSEFKDTEDRLQYHFRFERLVSNISTSFVNAKVNEIDNVIENALKLTCEFFNTDRGYIFLLDKSGTRILNPYEWCNPGVKSLKGKYDNFSLTEFSLEKILSEPIDEFLQFSTLGKIPLKYEKIRDLLLDDGTIAILLMPLIVNKRLIGLFGYDCVRETRTWSDEEISLLKVIGEVFSSAINRKEAEHDRIMIEAHRQQSDKADSLGKLAEAVAHQFNNQLQIVIGNLELLKVDNQSPQKKKHNDAMKAAMKAAELSSMLMAYLSETHGKPLKEKIRIQAQHSETLPRQLEGGYILVIEDDQMVRFITTSMLQHFNFKVLEACDGAEALKVLAKHRDQIRLVICDLIMPGLDGWQTLAAIHKKAPGLPFILASGYDDAMALKGSHTELPQAFLRKPFNSASLQEAIRMALSS